jgi:lipid A 3-O-deacylase
MVPAPFYALKEIRLCRSKAPLRRAATRLALFFFAIVAADRAAAQITFGSPGEPSQIALGGGVFNVIANYGKANSYPVGMALGEYRFGDAWWIISPFVGVLGTGQGAFYGYFGISFDVHLPYGFILTPSEAFGYFEPGGHGYNLGSWAEFRSGAELAYHFSDGRRFGVGFYHVSNAGFGKSDPGEEMVTSVLTVPFR